MSDNIDLLHDEVCRDLHDRDGVETRVIAGLMKFFSPYNSQYVARVSAWQELLCSGYCLTSSILPLPLLVQGQIITSDKRGFHFLGETFAVRCCHQIAMLHWKYEVSDVPECFDDMARRLSTSGRPQCNAWIGRLRQRCKTVLGQAPSLDMIMGRCGSGATADRLDRCQRWALKDRPRAVPPIVFRSNIFAALYDPPHAVPYGIARAASVPKNRKSRRYVASEPNSFMFTQLGLMRELDRRLRTCFGRHTPIWDAELHKKVLRLPNRATIDLSNASDMISRRLISAILPGDWLALLRGCRSSFLELPDHRIVGLRTFAPMGNGFCFRILTLVVALITELFADDSHWSVFGDDIIVDRRSYDSVRYALTQAGLVVNSTKSCCGRYVESCGLELLDGVDITPWRPKRLMVRGNCVIDLAAAEIAGDRDLITVADSIIDNVRVIARSRYNRRYQCKEYLLPVWVARSDKLVVDDWPGLLRWFVCRGESFDKTVDDKVHVCKGRRWVSEEDPLARVLLLRGR